MKKGTLLKKWFAVLATAILTACLFAIPAFADDGTPAKKLSTGTIVGIVIGAVVLVAAVVLGIIFREKIKKFLRIYKSEAKKIVWLPWSQTRKSTVTVLIILVICAVVISLLDFGLSKGFLAFIGLF